jgi:putative two-component system response regulator
MDSIKNQTILCVDDDKKNLKLLELCLAPQGYTLKFSGSGPDALAQVEAEQPDLILLDMMMPGMSGLEVLERLRREEKTRLLPVVLVTSLNAAEDKIQGIEAGCDDFISKPFDKNELLARVKSLLRIKAFYDQMQNYERNLEAEVARKTEKLQSALKKLDQAYAETIYRLSRAGEYRDEDTGTHVMRVSRYTKAIARRMGLKENFAEAFFYASPMHDIGKIGVPDAILLKPGKLNPEEWEIMKRHTTIGAQILKGSKDGVIKMAEVIALTHHEKWDGNGYPKGLKGNKIPLAGRITAIADVFDALISRRPYKEPFPLEKAFEIIKASEGSHFDPQIVSAFFDCQDEIITIVEQCRVSGEASLLERVKA